MRLQKAIASAGVCSRRASEELILSGKVLVNSKRASLGQSADFGKDEIIVEGKKISPFDNLSEEKKVYFVLNKPKGVITTASDDRGRLSAAGMIKTKYRIVPVGRVDKNTTGILILTNDGDLVNRLTHPKFEHEKEYEALVQIPHDWNDERIQNAVRKLRSGVIIANDFKTSPADASVLNKISNNRHILRVIIHEGHKHQVRQMIDAVGMSILALKRVRVGFLRIGDLKEGEYRELSQVQASELKK